MNSVSLTITLNKGENYYEEIAIIRKKWVRSN